MPLQSLTRQFHNRFRTPTRITLHCFDQHHLPTHRSPHWPTIQLLSHTTQLQSLLWRTALNHWLTMPQFHHWLTTELVLWPITQSTLWHTMLFLEFQLTVHHLTSEARTFDHCRHTFTNSVSWAFAVLSLWWNNANKIKLIFFSITKRKYFAQKLFFFISAGHYLHFHSIWSSIVVVYRTKTGAAA